jgi:hypothetical protein
MYHYILSKRVYEDTYVDHEFDDEVYCEARYRIAA